MLIPINVPVSYVCLTSNAELPCSSKVNMVVYNLLSTLLEHRSVTLGIGHQHSSRCRSRQDMQACVQALYLSLQCASLAPMSIRSGRVECGSGSAQRGSIPDNPPSWY